MYLRNNLKQVNISVAIYMWGWLNGFPFLCIYNFPLILYFIKNPSVI